LAINIGFAAIMHSVWGMTWALLVSTAFNAVVSFIIMDRRKLQLRIDQEHLASMLRFGKWIFISTLTYFAASNFDRLYLPAHIPLALFGVYGIARSMSELATQLMQRVGGVVIFPAIARYSETLNERKGQIMRLRSAGLAVVSIGIGGGVAIGDLFVLHVYDPRYVAAAVILPVLLLGAWFSVQATIADSVVLGLSKSSHAAAANLAKFGFIILLVPVTFAFGDLFLVFLVLACADVPRYIVLLVAQHRRGLHFFLHDIVLFSLAVATFFVTRLALERLGLIDGLITSAQWHQIHILLATV
jgi:O-antigen/teichoic acid export membrane protein